MHTRTRHLSIFVAVFIAEVLVATTFSNVIFIRSYISDFLVVILLYHFVKVFLDTPPSTLAAVVFVFACGVEVSQHFHLVDALGVRHGSLLYILIGTSFSWIDILMYFLGCLTSFLVDSFLISERAPKGDQE